MEDGGEVLQPEPLELAPVCPAPELEPPPEQEAYPTPERRSKDRLETALVVGALWIPTLITAVATFLEPPQQANTVLQELYSCAQEAGKVVLVLLISLRIGGGLSGIRIERPTFVRVLQAVNVLVAAFALQFVTRFATMPLKDLPNFRVAFGHPYQSAILTIVYVTVAVTYEEVFYRGYLASRLEGLGQPTLAVALVTSILFASTHIYQGWYGPIHAFGFGLLAYGSRRLYGSLWPGFLAHLAFNGLVLTQALR